MIRRPRWPTAWAAASGLFQLHTRSLGESGHVLREMKCAEEDWRRVPRNGAELLFQGREPICAFPR